MYDNYKKYSSNSEAMILTSVESIYFKNEGCLNVFKRFKDARALSSKGSFGPLKSILNIERLSPVPLDDRIRITREYNRRSLTEFTNHCQQVFCCYRCVIVGISYASLTFFLALNSVQMDLLSKDVICSPIS